MSMQDQDCWSDEEIRTACEQSAQRIFERLDSEERESGGPTLTETEDLIDGKSPT